MEDLQTVQVRAQQAAAAVAEVQRRDFAACVSKILECPVDPATVDLTWTTALGRYPARVSVDGLCFLVRPGEVICDTQEWVRFAADCACGCSYTVSRVWNLAELASLLQSPAACNPKFCDLQRKPDLPVPSQGDAQTEQIICPPPWWRFWRYWKGKPWK